MPLSIKNTDVERLARELARRRRTTITEAIRQSLEREIARERRIPRDHLKPLYDRLKAVAERTAALPTLSDATEDEILGYDDFGIPTQ